MKKKSGIYKIENIITGDFYIGQSVDIIKRKSNHFSSLEKHKHHNIHLQRSYDKYGKSVFVSKVLIYCEPFELTRYEQYFVDILKPIYNICVICVDSPRGIKRSSEWVANRKMNFSMEVREKMRKSALKRKGPRGIHWDTELKNKNVNIGISKKEINCIVGIGNFDKEKFLFALLVFSKMKNQSREIRNGFNDSEYFVENRYGSRIKHLAKLYCELSVIDGWYQEFNASCLLISEEGMTKVLFADDDCVNIAIVLSPEKNYQDAVIEYEDYAGFPCINCGKRIIRNSNHQKYCDECYDEKRKDDKRRVYGIRHKDKDTFRERLLK